MITIDPKAVNQIRDVKQAVIGLTSEVTKLANEAERYARAIGARPGGGGAGTGPGRRAANFPMPMSPPPGSGGGEGGGGGGGGGFGQGRGLDLRTAILLPMITKAIASQIGAVIDRERITSRLGMAQTGAYNPATFGNAGGTQGPWQRMIRQTPIRGGYTSTGDLYAGAQTLGTLGLMRSPDDPATRRAIQEASQLALMSGTNFQGAAGMMGTFMSPQAFNAMRQRGINPTPGGRLNMFGQQGVLEQVYGHLGRGRGESFWRTGLRPGSPLYYNLQNMGFGEQEMAAMQQYGLMRAEGIGAADIEAELKRRYHDTGENLDELRGAMSKLRDSLSDSLVPLIVGLADVATPVLDAIGKMLEPLNRAQKSIVALGIAATIAAWRLSRSGGGGGAPTGGGGGVPGPVPAGGPAGPQPGPVSRGMSGLGAPGAMATSGVAAVTGSFGSQVGRDVGGTGWKGKAGSIAGGAAAGAAGGAVTGAALGLLGGPFAELTVPAGAAAGAVYGGITGAIGGMFGDGSMEGVGDAYPTDAQLLANPPPNVKTPGGGPLPGGGNSSNLNPEFVKRLQAMFAANPKLSLTSGWRSHEEQAYLRWKHLTGKKKEPVAPVGRSKHESGYAADIGPASEYGWLAANAPKYGLNLPMPGVEPWHWELPKGAGGDWKAPDMGALGAANTGTQALGTASSPGGKPSAAVMAPKRTSSSSMNEADILHGFFTGGGGYASGGGGGESDTGDAFLGGPGLSVGMGATGSTVHVGKIEINLTLARATYEEAEKTARYLGQILGDRDRLMSLARS